jgi:hypothetical protein
MKGVRSNRFLLPSVIGVVLACFAAPPTFAEQTPEQACAPDVMRLCQEFVPDHGRIAACLSRKSRQLSPACRSVMMSVKKKKQRHASR